MPQRSVYIKFSIMKGSKYLEGFTISEDIDKARSWDRDNPNLNVNADLYNFNPDEKSPFSGLGDTLVARTDVFRKTTPFLMSRLPQLIGETIDARFKKFVSKHGKIIDEDEDTQLYEISSKLLATQSIELSRLRALLAGGDQLPSLFLIGLISAFDSFFLI